MMAAFLSRAACIAWPGVSDFGQPAGSGKATYLCSITDINGILSIRIIIRFESDGVDLDHRTNTQNHAGHDRPVTLCRGKRGADLPVVKIEALSLEDSVRKSLVKHIDSIVNQGQNNIFLDSPGCAPVLS